MTLKEHINTQINIATKYTQVKVHNSDLRTKDKAFIYLIAIN
jgi:hypothetical protein